MNIPSPKNKKIYIFLNENIIEQEQTRNKKNIRLPYCSNALHCKRMPVGDSDDDDDNAFND